MLKEFKLLKNLSEGQLQDVTDTCRSQTYLPGEVLFKEGEHSTDIYFLKSGRVGLYKADPKTQEEICFKQMEAGESFGEMSFVDGSPRSCSIKAEIESTVYILSKQQLVDGVRNSSDIISQLSLAINQQVNEYLRYLSDRHIISLQSHIDELKERNRFGTFLLLVLASLFSIMFLAAFSNEFLPTGTATSQVFNWAGLLFLVLTPLLIAGYKMKLPILEIGITTKKLGKSIVDGILFTSIGALLIYLVCLGLDNFLPDIELVKSFLNIPLNFVIFSVYAIHSYLQEFCRAITQTSIQQFLKDDRGWYTVGMTAVTFAMTHAHLGSIVIGVAFLSSLLFSWIYMRTYNVAGVTIVHAVLGYIVLSMVLSIQGYAV